MGWDVEGATIGDYGCWWRIEALAGEDLFFFAVRQDPEDVALGAYVDLVVCYVCGACPDAPAEIVYPVAFAGICIEAVEIGGEVGDIEEAVLYRDGAEASFDQLGLPYLLSCSGIDAG